MPTRRILIVEDNADTRWAMRAVLEFDGHHVDEAKDGPEGLRAALGGTYDVVLLDLNLPGMSGYEVARKIRQAAKPAILIALTGHGLDRDQEGAFDAGFDAYLLKPLSPQALAAMVTDASRRKP